jgi:hypothetical protein
VPEPLEFSDRYDGNYPDPETVCPGDCEGMGFYPESDPEVIAAAGKTPDSLGFAFLTCGTCGGTGKRPSATT